MSEEIKETSLSTSDFHFSEEKCDTPYIKISNEGLNVEVVEIFANEKYENSYQ